MKNEIRRRLRAENLALTPTQRDQFANEVFTQIERSEKFIHSKNIAIFASLKDEIPTQRIIEMWATKKRVLLPRVEEGFRMEFYEYSPSNMATGSFGILEPSTEQPFPARDIDMIIVPGVAFTTEGDRLGRGKGYYDRFLSRVGVSAYTLGVCYKHQICSSLPIEEHDIKLDKVIYPL